jgi:hypothetical protein
MTRSCLGLPGVQTALAAAHWHGVSRRHNGTRSVLEWVLRPDELFFPVAHSSFARPKRTQFGSGLLRLINEWCCNR